MHLENKPIHCSGAFSSEKKHGSRLVALDSLRGIAAFLVMLFHFTTRYDQSFGHSSPPIFSVPWGHYGVNLFFMISGFVIFLTLHRIQSPLDFIVSRFSRLYPAFWAAVAATFLFTKIFELPGLTVSLTTAMLNFMMFHGLFKIPSVDGVYWTLEVELLFYFWALVVYKIGLLEKIHGALLLFFTICLGYFIANRYFEIELSYTLSHLLILPFIAWFGCGIMVYRRVYVANQSAVWDLLVLLAAWLLLGIVENWWTGLLAFFLSILMYTTARGHLPFLANPILVWLGGISYTLYLLHENIGWALIFQMQRLGVGVNVSIGIAIVVSLLLATALSNLIEIPVMRWIRERYKKMVPKH